MCSDPSAHKAADPAPQEPREPWFRAEVRCGKRHFALSIADSRDVPLNAFERVYQAINGVDPAQLTAAPSALPPETALRALVADWRERGRRARPLECAPVSAQKRAGVAEWMSYTNRANELEAALSALPPEKVEEKENAGLPGTPGRAESDAMRLQQQLASAEAIGRTAHAQQRCTVTGEPYILHVERVASMVSGEYAKAVAWLHDVLEDSDFTEAELRRLGIDDTVLDAVALLTKPDNDCSMVLTSYAQYIFNIKRSGNQLALAVKLADLRDHLRPDCPERLFRRYLDAWLVLTGEPFDVAQPVASVGTEEHPADPDTRTIPSSSLPTSEQQEEEEYP